MSLRQKLKSKIATESAIQYQLDNSNLKAIENIILEMTKDLDSYPDNKLHTYYKTKEFKTKRDKIEKILEETFNIEFVIGNNSVVDFFSGYGYGRAKNQISSRLDPVKTKQAYEPGNSFDSLLKDSENIIKSNNLTEEEIKNLSRDYDNFSILAIEGNNELINVILEEGLKLDLKNVRFVNKPKKLKFYINLDFIVGSIGRKCMFYNIPSPLTPSEFVSIMLHEIGHCWEQVYSLFKLGTDVDVLQDIVREEVSKGNKNLPSIIEIFYTKNGIPNKPSSNPVQAMVELNRILLERSNSHLAPNRSVRLNLEQQADEFASRFGYGKHISTALVKLGDYDPDETMLVSQTWITGIMISSALIVAFTELLVGVLIFVFFIPMLIMSMFLIARSIFVEGKEINNYDFLYRRIMRIKNATVRRLKFIEDPMVKENIIANIDDLNKTIDKLKKMENNKKIKKFFENIITKFSKDKRDININEMLEDLISNDLIVGYEKMKMIQKDLK